MIKWSQLPHAFHATMKTGPFIGARYGYQHQRQHGETSFRVIAAKRWWPTLKDAIKGAEEEGFSYRWHDGKMELMHPEPARYFNPVV